MSRAVWLAGLVVAALAHAQAFQPNAYPGQPQPDAGMFSPPPPPPGSPQPPPKPPDKPKASPAVMPPDAGRPAPDMARPAPSSPAETARPAPVSGAPGRLSDDGAPQDDIEEYWTDGGEPGPNGPVTVPPPEAAPPPQPVKVRGAIEGTVATFPSGTPGGKQDLFVNLQPIFGIDAGDPFELELAPMFRLRVLDDTPNQRDGDIGKILRGKDWDQLSDLGQVIRLLRVSRPDKFLWLRLGAVEEKTLGLGHLITRYSNQDNPDYHPASAEIGLHAGPVRIEAFASDFLGARLFAGEGDLDLGRTFSKDPGWFDKIHLALSFAYDFGEAGYVAPQAGLGELDLSIALYSGPKARVLALLGGGARFDVLGAGALAGLAVDSDLGNAQVGGRIELRKQGGSYRQGFFGPGYELSRFSGIGFTQPAQAAESLPDGFSVYVDARTAFGKAVHGDAAFEHYSWGRTDLDVRASFLLINERLIATTRFTMVGVGLIPRYAFTAEARVRLFASFYLLGTGGTVFFPQPDGTLVRGVTAGVGVGLDFER